MGKIIRQLRKQERYKTKNGKKKNFLPSFSCGGRTNLPTAKTTKISC